MFRIKLMIIVYIINKIGEKTNNNLIEQFIELDDEDLNNMKEEDKAILKTPQKLYRINKGKKRTKRICFHR